MLLFAQRTAGASLHKDSRDGNGLAVISAAFALGDGQARELVSDFDHIDTDAGEVRAAGVADVVLEADETDVFRDIAAMLPKAFPRAIGKLIGSGKNGGDGPLLVQNVGDGGVPVFEFVVGKGDGVDVRLKRKLRHGTGITAVSIAVPWT